MHVIVTRPTHLSANIIDRLVCAQHHYTHIPLIQIHDLALSKKALSDLSAYNSFIFTSQNSVISLVTAIEKHSDTALADALSQSSCVAIGNKTAQLLAQYGFNVALEAAPPYTSESLLQHEALNECLGDRCAIIKGQAGRLLLQNELKNRGIIVDQVDVYQRRSMDQPLIIEAWKKAQDFADIGALMLTSVEASTAMMEALKTANLYDSLSASIIAGSTRIATALTQDSPQLAQRIIIARSPTDEDMLDALQQLT